MIRRVPRITINHWPLTINLSFRAKRRISFLSLLAWPKSNQKVKASCASHAFATLACLKIRKLASLRTAWFSFALLAVPSAHRPRPKGRTPRAFEARFLTTFGMTNAVICVDLHPFAKFAFGYRITRITITRKGWKPDIIVSGQYSAVSQQINMSTNQQLNNLTIHRLCGVYKSWRPELNSFLLVSIAESGIMNI